MSVEYGSGYVPGVLGWCTARHGQYYAAEWGFGLFFETGVAADMAAFLRRLDEPGNHVFWARDRDGFCATLSIDGGDAEDGLAHLRWFIADARTRGQGVGGRLIERAIAAVREDGAAGVYLWTFAGLDAARRVYEKAGFRLVKEIEDTTWGTPVLEQRFEVNI